MGRGLRVGSWNIGTKLLLKKAITVFERNLMHPWKKSEKYLKSTTRWNRLKVLRIYSPKWIFQRWCEASLVSCTEDVFFRRRSPGSFFVSRGAVPGVAPQPGATFAVVSSAECSDFIVIRFVRSLGEWGANVFTCEWSELSVLVLLSVRSRARH